MQAILRFKNICFAPCRASTLIGRNRYTDSAHSVAVTGQEPADSAGTVIDGAVIYRQGFKLGQRGRPTTSGKCSTEAMKWVVETQNLPCRFGIRPASYIRPFRHAPQQI